MGNQVTIRRDLLDQILVEAEENFLTGQVLDIGGKKTNKRGAWRPSQTSGIVWRYLNLDAETSPDFLRPAEATELADSSIDCFVMCELLEHVKNPEAVITEAHRILRPGGVGLITMPFLNQVHADPNDFQRWTASKLRAELENAGFEIEQLAPMGSTFAVVFDLFLASIGRWQSTSSRPIFARFWRLILKAQKPLVKALDKKVAPIGTWVTTGWCVKVTAPFPST